MYSQIIVRATFIPKEPADSPEPTIIKSIWRADARLKDVIRWARNQAKSRGLRLSHFSTRYGKCQHESSL